MLTTFIPVLTKKTTNIYFYEGEKLTLKKLIKYVLGRLENVNSRVSTSLMNF